MIELKPCPFCGGDAAIRESSLGHKGTGEFRAMYEVGCKECGIKFVRQTLFRLVNGQPSFICNGHDECVTMWNRRAGDPDD